ncbi:ABC transporter transmembrane domain-containing protein [Streptomyces sp. NPDC127068]|uniref:ABC transporter transmembrane domain-containing protein n=1 Tax=Streptomyces sp. NPDC127068 TaxID=3347127 RepID=UPI00364A6E3F
MTAPDTRPAPLAPRPRTAGTPTGAPGGAPPAAGPGALIAHGSFGAGRGWRLGLASAGFAGHQVAEALVPVLIGVVIDRAIGRGDPHVLLGLLALLAGLFAVLILCWRTATRLTTEVYSSGEHDLRLMAAGRVLHSRGTATKRATGDVLTVATSDASNVSGVSWVLAEQGAALAGLLTATVALLLISWQLAVLVLVVAALQLLVLHLLSGPLERRVHVEQREAARAGTLATDFTRGLRVLKGFDAEPAAADRYREASRVSVRAALRRVGSLADLSAVNSAVSGAFLAALALAAGSMALDGTLTVGQLVTAVGLAQVVAGPMQTLGFLGAAVAAKRGSAHRLAELLAIPYRVPETGPGAPSTGTRDRTRDPGPRPPSATGSTTAAGTLFALHRGPSVITAERGELIGVRARDAWAADLADLIACRRAPAPGEYVLNGRDASTLTPDEVRRTVFAPPHDSVVFSGTVAENLAAATADPAAIAASALDDVLTHLPAGTASDVGEQGRSLSGGQRQRLLLARALHQPQPVLVLHEPTTSVDSVTEDRIARALRGHGDRAIVLVTTSPTLLEACDRVHEAGPPPPHVPPDTAAASRSDEVDAR